MSLETSRKLWMPRPRLCPGRNESLSQTWEPLFHPIPSYDSHSISWFRSIFKAILGYPPLGDLNPFEEWVLSNICAMTHIMIRFGPYLRRLGKDGVQPPKPRCAEEVCKVTGKDVYELGDISRFLDGQAKSQAGPVSQIYTVGAKMEQ